MWYLFASIAIVIVGFLLRAQMKKVSKVNAAMHRIQTLHYKKNPQQFEKRIQYNRKLWEQKVEAAAMLVKKLITEEEYNDKMLEIERNRREMIQITGISDETLESYLEDTEIISKTMPNK